MKSLTKQPLPILLGILLGGAAVHVAWTLRGGPSLAAPTRENPKLEKRIRQPGGVDSKAKRAANPDFSTADHEAAWRQSAGALVAEYTRVGALRRGKLEVVVANSTLMQELLFQKSDLLKNLTQLLPDEGIQDLRFRLGAVA